MNKEELKQEQQKILSAFAVERAAIVKWLEHCAETHPHVPASALLSNAAHCIKRGDHLSQQPSKEGEV